MNLKAGPAWVTYILFSDSSYRGEDAILLVVGVLTTHLLRRSPPAPDMPVLTALGQRTVVEGRISGSGRSILVLRRM